MSEPPLNPEGLILAVNAGSSSLKISLYRRFTSAPAFAPVVLLLTSSITSLSAPPALFSFSLASHAEGRETKNEQVPAIHDHASAFAHFLEYLKEEASIDRSEIVHICHRVVHGGKYHEPEVLTDESYQRLERLSDLAPLHNGGALTVMQASIDQVPSASSIAYFDTSFHCSIPEYISSYAINQDVAKKRGLKKYGFHGLSYAFITRTASEFLHKPADQTNLIVMHLGSGASICAIRNGRSLDTSMGLTPLSGLPGATRSGTVDPSLIFHYTNKAQKITHKHTLEEHVHVTMAEEVLNREAGWKALTGTADFGEVVRGRAEEGAHGETCRLAFDLFVDRIVEYVGGYYLKLDGQVDALVFAGGIGERSVELREALCAKARIVGFELDEGKNARVNDDGAVVVDVGTKGEGETKRVLVCRTDEQMEMARQCALADKFWQ